MKIKTKCEPMDRGWLDRCRANGWTIRKPLPERTTADFDFPIKKYEELKQRLLEVAGQAVCLHIEDDLLDILRRGSFIRGYHAIMMRGDDCRCHANSAACWDTNRGLIKIATGYALSRDGMWRQHTWCVKWNGAIDAWQVIETTERRLLYYGFVMNRHECEMFLLNNA